GFVININGVQKLSIDIELKLVAGAVADADGAGFFVSFEMTQLLFAKVLPPIYAVHHLQRQTGFEFAATRLDPAHESSRFTSVTQSHQGVDCKGSIPYPGIAIVPIAYSSDFLRQPEGGGGYDGTITSRS